MTVLEDIISVTDQRYKEFISIKDEYLPTLKDHYNISITLYPSPPWHFTTAKKTLCKVYDHCIVIQRTGKEIDIDDIVSSSHIINSEIPLLFSLPEFGCCHLFKECSESKHCVHDNYLYSSISCAYKKNLDAGQVFYNEKPEYLSIDIASAKPTSVRTKKGKSLLDSLSDYVVIDLETTGLDPHWDDIIEFAAIRIVNCEQVDSFTSLINPEYEINGFITELTGITNDMLTSAPLLSDVLPQFIKFISNSVVIAHNANFDINFLYDNCVNVLGTEFENDFVDTMRVSRRLYKEYRHHRLTDLVNRFGIVGGVEHRALSDVSKTYQCYEYMKKYAADNAIDFSALYPNKSGSKKSGFRAIDISTYNTEFDSDSFLYSNTFVFTGTLEKMTRKEAMQLVVDAGGSCSDTVTKETDFLVLGESDYRRIKDGKSSKLKKAEKLQLSGADIKIISETVFYDMLPESLP